MSSRLFDYFVAVNRGIGELDALVSFQQARMQLGSPRSHQWRSWWRLSLSVMCHFLKHLHWLVWRSVYLCQSPTFPRETRLV